MKKDTQTEQEQQTNGVAGKQGRSNRQRTEQPRTDVAGKQDAPKRKPAPDGTGAENKDGR
ncbi:hypothetical protein [uncultured Alistipes sp.]|jgi:hypothetical protein|uniref:hypothetical protein n=1 Tax=Alistipes sp. TaxID=1872444 RepID=UPI00266D3C38|nr:hypothetical protein [uncultured Alistipes sp.]